MTLSATASANVAVLDSRFSTPRPFGYFIGDLIEHRLHLRLAPGYYVDQSVLPSPGRVNTWLELRPPQVDQRIERDGVVYDINLVYQLINTLTHTYGLATPPVVIGVTGENGESFPLVFPAWGFSISPIDFAEAVPKGMLPTLKPDKLPPSIPVAPQRLRLTLWLAGLAAVLLYLGYLYGVLPLFQRRTKPFSRAYKDLRRLTRSPPTLECEQRAFREVHRAFDQTATRSLFQPGLTRFFQEHPSYGALREPIEQFFADSREVFFEHRQGAVDGEVLVRLLALCRSCREIERGAA